MGKRNVLFVPISIDGTIPFGFISNIQGKLIAKTGVADLVIAPILKRFPRHLIPRLIRRLAGAKSFRGAEALMSPLAACFTLFDKADIDAFAKTAIENGQIWDAAECATVFLPEFLKVHRSKMEPNHLAALEFQINNRTWYRFG